MAMPSLKHGEDGRLNAVDVAPRSLVSECDQTILVVAALSYELASLRADPNPELVLLETGEGIANAERQLEAWLAQNTARAVLSRGVAGALSTSVKPGDLGI